MKYLLKLFKNGKKICRLDKARPPYSKIQNCYYKKTVPIDYVDTRGYHYIYKEK